LTYLVGSLKEIGLPKRKVVSYHHLSGTMFPTSLGIERSHIFFGISWSFLPRYTWKGICVMMLVGCTATTRCAVLRPGSTWKKTIVKFALPFGGRHDSSAKWGLFCIDINGVIYIITPINGLMNE